MQLRVCRVVRCTWSVRASIVVVLILAMGNIAQAQYTRACGTPSPLSSRGPAPIADATGRPHLGGGGLELVPSICVSERYDSNVYFAPPTPGLRRDDFVTNVNPQLRVNHHGEYADGYLEAGGFSETYINSPGLNYIGTADTLYLNLDNSIRRLLPNATLSITDNVRYTPTPPGFSNPIAGTSPGSPANIQNIYAQGLLSYRANNLTNNATVLTSYNVTPLTSLNASYSHAILRFGAAPVTSASQLTLFDTTSQTATIGAKTQLSARDTLSVTYSRSQSEFISHATSIPSTFFNVDSAILGWARTLTSYLTAQIGGGAIVIDPGLTTYALNASVMLNTPNHNATISYARSAAPSYIGVGVPIISDSFSLTAIQKIALQWQLAETAAYVHSSGGSSPATVRYDSYFASVDLYYWMTNIWSTALSFDYMNFDSEFASAKTSYDRYTVTISLKAAWN